MGLDLGTLLNDDVDEMWFLMDGLVSCPEMLLSSGSVWSLAWREEEEAEEEVEGSSCRILVSSSAVQFGRMMSSVA